MNRATASRQPALVASRSSPAARVSTKGFDQAQGDLDLIADCFAAMPDLTSVRRIKADDLITTEGWLVWIEGSWLADHAGRGATIRSAYDDAKQRLAAIRSAA